MSFLLIVSLLGLRFGALLGLFQLSLSWWPWEGKGFFPGLFPSLPHPDWPPPSTGPIGPPHLLIPAHSVELCADHTFNREEGRGLLSQSISQSINEPVSLFLKPLHSQHFSIPSIRMIRSHCRKVTPSRFYDSLGPGS